MTPPLLTDQGHLMLAAFGERSTLADFKVAVDLRPELSYDEADCLVGLEALADAGCLKSVRVKAGADPEWEITKTGQAILAGPRGGHTIGAPSAVMLEPQPGIAATSSEA